MNTNRLVKMRVVCINFIFRAPMSSLNHVIFSAVVSVNKKIALYSEFVNQVTNNSGQAEKGNKEIYTRDVQE